MKKFFLFILVFSPLLMTNCKSDDVSELDCSAVLCLTQELAYDIISKETGENLFKNETFNPAQLSVINQKNGENVNFFYDTNNSIRIFTGVQKTTQIEYIISIPTEFEFTVTYEAVPSGLNTCCPSIKLNDFKIENINYEEGEYPNSYKILVD